MTRDEYISEKISIKEECEERLKALAIKYAIANNPHKIGDMIRDITGKIIIEKITVSTAYEKPCCVYEGPELRKDGTPKLSGARRKVWQCSIMEN